MMKSIVIFFLMFMSSLAYTQNEWWKAQDDSSRQEVNKTMNHVERSPTNLTQVEQTNNTYSEDTNHYVEPEVFQPGEITVVKSPLIDKVIKFKSATIPPYSGPIMDGYRIQLFFDQSRKEVDKARSQVLELDSNTPTYIEYKAPNYFLLQGNYRTKLQAEKIRASLISDFPAALVIKDKIYLPKIKLEED